MTGTVQPSPRAGSSAITAVSIYGRAAPSTRVRITDWLDHFHISEVEFVDHAGRANNRISDAWRHVPELIAGEIKTRKLSNLKRERVLLSREAGLLSRGAVEAAFLGNAEHGVYDLDDAIFHDVEGIRRAYGKAEKARAGAEAADVVVVGNEYLANWADDYARDVRIIPSCVQPADYRAKTSWEILDAPTIVWLGSFATERYVEHIAAELAEVHRRTSARLRIVGARKAKEHPAIAEFVERIPWSEEIVADALSTADVAIAPLDDSAYSRGKCAYKLLQYGASGLPMVGSPVGANKRALELFDGVSVESRSDWADGLVAVIEESSDARRWRGLAGLEAVSKHYSFDAWGDDWRKAVGLQGIGLPRESQRP